MSGWRKRRRALIDAQRAIFDQHAGAAVAASAGVVAGWAGFLAFAAPGAVVVWRAGGNWQVRR